MKLSRVPRRELEYFGTDDAWSNFQCGFVHYVNADCRVFHYRVAEMLARVRWSIYETV